MAEKGLGTNTKGYTLILPALLVWPHTRKQFDSHSFHSLLQCFVLFFLCYKAHVTGHTNRPCTALALKTLLFRVTLLYISVYSSLTFSSALCTTLSFSSVITFSSFFFFLSFFCMCITWLMQRHQADLLSFSGIEIEFA